MKEVHRHLVRGNTDVVDADLSRYFESTPALGPPQVGGPRVVDRNVLRLIEDAAETPVEERDADGTRRMSGGKGKKLGTPQGAVVSPLLANIYMNRFLKHFRQSGAAGCVPVLMSLPTPTISSSSAVAAVPPRR